IVSVSVAYVMIYARKVKKNPEISSMYTINLKRNTNTYDQKEYKLTKRQSAIIVVLLLTIVGLAFGVTIYEWYITEIAGVFLLMGIIVGFIGKLIINEIADGFIKGSKELVFGALLVVFDYVIIVVL